MPPDQPAPIHLLPIDDDPAFADLLAEAFESKIDEIVVDSVAGPADGLDRLDAGKYDCVVCDYDMPSLDGLAVLEKVRSRDEELPFILFTGKGSEEVASEAISAGVTDYL